MLSAEAMVLPQAAADEVKAYLRMFTTDENGEVRACLAAAAELCERFTGQALLVRTHEERLASSGGWMRLSAGPVTAIGGVQALGPDGSAVAVPVDAYAIDIDADGQGWVRTGAGRVRVSYQAGLTTGWSGLPEALRHGIVRLAAHLFMERGEMRTAPPAAVSALWRPWRQMRIGGGHVRTA